jgi:hypothetical protein
MMKNLICAAVTAVCSSLAQASIPTNLDSHLPGPAGARSTDSSQGFQAANRKGSKRVGGTNRSGKGSKYRGGRNS